MKNHRYRLEKYDGIKSRYRCPNCHHQKEFSRYIDTQTNEYLSEKKIKPIVRDGYFLQHLEAT